MNSLEKRVVDLSYKYKLSHISSCLTSVHAIDGIYSVKKENEPFILSNGHAGLALYVVLEKREKKDAEVLWRKYGTHPVRNKAKYKVTLKAGYNEDDGIWCSTGSLGMGLTVAVGMALADRSRNVYVMVSDGEMAEGCCWEALRIASEQKLENLRITVIGNGYSALGKVDTALLDLRMQYFYPSLMNTVNLFSLPDWLQGLEGHYHVMTKGEYESLMEGEGL